jgi:hypothetical protein
MAEKHSRISEASIRPGDRFGRWTIVEVAPRVKPMGNRRFICRCDCSSVKTVAAQSLTHGHTTSCGCRRKEVSRDRLTTHGFTAHPLYYIWKAMIFRCESNSHRSFHRYGGRGIGVCDEWRRDINAFAAYVGNRPSKKHSLERLDNDKGYEPGNVVWATRRVQQQNTCRNVWLDTCRGRMLAIEVARIAGVSSIKVVTDRHRRGWLGEELFSPPREKGRRKSSMPLQNAGPHPAAS